MLEAVNISQEERMNFCTTSIPRYNLFKASPSQWQKAKQELLDTNINFDASSSEITNELIQVLDKIVIKTFDKPSPYYYSGTWIKEYNTKKSKNIDETQAEILQIY